MNNGEHKSEWYMKMNPAHKVPVLKDGEFQKNGVKGFLTDFKVILF